MFKKFILSCPDDRLTMSRWQILKKAIAWLAVLCLTTVAIRVACLIGYMAIGINPMELTQFGGDAKSHDASLRTFFLLLVIAPVCEELLCRLPLAFKKKIVELWVILLPLVIAGYFFHQKNWLLYLGLLILGTCLAWLINKYTTDEQWAAWRTRFIVPAMWTAAIIFGLLHLLAFTEMSFMLIPFIVTTIMVPFAGGCIFTYARVNLGFWWGVLFHMCFNIPALLAIFLNS